MKIEKIKKSVKEKATIEGYQCFKGKSMVRIGGNFMGGGFLLSKNKTVAVLQLAKELKPFADGELDRKISKLKEDEVLKP